MRRFLSAVLAFALGFGPVCAAFAQQESPADVYVRALGVMQSLPEPPYLTYQSTFSSPTVQINVAPYGGAGALFLALGRGPSAVAWRTDYYGPTAQAVLVLQNGTKLNALSPIFNPTWRGAYDWLRYGLQGRPALGAQSAQPASTGLKTIAALTALSPGAYDVDAGGAQMCPGGTSGVHLRFHPRFDPDAHPLTDVVIDDASNRICSMRFRIGSKGLVYAMTGFMELHFAQAGRYWLVSGGSGDIVMQFFGEAYRHGSIDFAYTGVAFTPQETPVRVPSFTAALFTRKPAKTGPAAVALAAQPPKPAEQLKTIEHITAIPLCETLKQNVLQAIDGLRTNDAIALQMDTAVRDLAREAVAGSRFATTGQDRNTVNTYAGKDDPDPGLAMTQMQLSRYIAQIRHNLDLIYAALNDPKRFPSPAVTDSDKQAEKLKQALVALAKQQEKLLDSVSGMNDTLSMQQMMAQGDGTFGATNEPDGNTKRNVPAVTGVDDKPVSFGDPLDEMDPASRKTDPSISEGRIGGTTPGSGSAAAQNTATASDLSSNPLLRTYAGALQNEQQAQKAEAELASAVRNAAAKCQM